jgi:hypothetical protein
MRRTNSLGATLLSLFIVFNPVFFDPGIWLGSLLTQAETLLGWSSSEKVGKCVDPDGQPVTCPTAGTSADDEYGAGLDPLGASGD